MGSPKLSEWTAALPPKARLARVSVWFAYSRGGPKTVLVRVGEAPPTKLKRVFDHFEAFFPLPIGGGSGGDDVRLSATYQADVPIPAKIELTVETSDGDPQSVKPNAFLPHWVGKPPVSDQPVLNHLWAQTVAGLAVPTSIRVRSETFGVDAVEVPEQPDKSAIFAQRREAVRARSRSELFFLRLDEATDPPQNPAWEQRTAELQRALEERVEARTHIGPDEIPRPSRLPRSGNLAKTVERVSSKIAACCEELGDMPVPMALTEEEERERVSWAFDLFVTGKLACHHGTEYWNDWLKGHGAPNSSNFFLFAEFAFLCIDNEDTPWVDVDTAFWRRHLETFVRTAHLLIDTPHPLTRAEKREASEQEALVTGDGLNIPSSWILSLRSTYTACVDKGPEDSAEVLRSIFTHLMATSRKSTLSPMVTFQRIENPPATPREIVEWTPPKVADTAPPTP